jgi:hypothetical protein
MSRALSHNCHARLYRTAIIAIFQSRETGSQISRCCDARLTGGTFGVLGYEATDYEPPTDGRRADEVVRHRSGK